MKLWHILLHSVFNINNSTAWVLSLFGLVVTVRAIITPFSWQIFKSGRASALMRPHKVALEKEYEHRLDEESIREFQSKQKALMKKFGVNPLAGCMPSLIQLPFFIGLYQVLRRMALPEGGFDNPKAIGFLTSEEVHTFLSGRLFNIPLPAYVSMSAEQFNYLNTSQEAVYRLVLPLLVLAALFTTFNMAVSCYRNYRMVDFSSGISVKMLKFLIGITVLIPLLTIYAGLHQPFPVAIALYWVTNNLWTLIQVIVLHLCVENKYPLDESFAIHQKQAREEFRNGRKEIRRFKWTRRKNRALMLLLPYKALKLHRANKNLIHEWKSNKTQQKSERKALLKQRRAAHKAINEKKRAERANRRKAAKVEAAEATD